MSGRWRRHTKQAIQWAIVVATVVVLVRVAGQHGSDLRDLDPNFNVFWLANAAVATIAANLILPLGWRWVLISFGQVLAKGRTVRLWCLAQTARYLPTGLLAIASRMQLAAKEGVPRALTATSIVIETAALFCWALLACSLFVPSTTLPMTLRWIAGSSAALGLLTAPWIIPYAIRRLSNVKNMVPSEVLPRLLAYGLALLGASVAARAVGTVCLAAGFLEIRSADVPLIVGASYAAIVAGMVGITPAGLGVREGMMTAILASRFGLGDAAAFALFSRAWEFAFEMLFLAAASWWGRKGRYANSSIKDSPVPEAKL